MLIKNTNKIEVYFVISFTGSFSLADRILIQLLCEVEPDVITEHYNEIIAGKSKNADAYVAVMWALIQPVGTLEKRLEGFLIFICLFVRAIEHYFQFIFNIFNLSSCLFHIDVILMLLRMFWKFLANYLYKQLLFLFSVVVK